MVLQRAVRLRAETKGEDCIPRASVWHPIQRLDPTSDPKDHGHPGSADRVKALDAVIQGKKGGSDHMLRVRWQAFRHQGSRLGLCWIDPDNH